VLFIDHNTQEEADMKPVLSDLSASITELKKNSSGLLEHAAGEPVVILKHTRDAKKGNAPPLALTLGV
jgi:hypothetical protein